MLNFSFNFGYFPRFSNTNLESSRESSVIKVKLYPVYPTHITVEWVIPANYGSCTFNIYRGATSNGPWVKLNTAPTASNHYRASLTADSSKFNNYFYIVECIRPNGSLLRSEPVTIRNINSKWVELRSREVSRREWLLLKKFTGVQSVIYKRRTFGKRCPECWDPITEKTIKDKCPTCLGTSFEGGYFPGYLTLLQYEPTQNNSELSYQGRIEPNVIPAWTIEVPEVDTFDIIVRLPDWKVYRVLAIQATELQSVVVRQLLSLSELDKNSIEFRLADRDIPTEYI